MLIKIYSAAPVGIDAVQVTIEVHAVPGFDFTLVGLPDASVKESHERISSALTVNNLGNLQRTYTINMAPADIKKEGAAFDLPLAIGMLAGAEIVRTFAATYSWCVTYCSLCSQSRIQRAYSSCR